MSVAGTPLPPEVNHSQPARTLCKNLLRLRTRSWTDRCCGKARYASVWVSVAGANVSERSVNGPRNDLRNGCTPDKQRKSCPRRPNEPSRDEGAPEGPEWPWRWDSSGDVPAVVQFCCWLQATDARWTWTLECELQQRQGLIRTMMEETI